MTSRKRKAVGESTSGRVASRGDLHSQNMPHGEVYRGPLADRALQAVGARAMTVDGEIIVNHSFNNQNPEDQALYAHEMYHQENSGGAAGAEIRDAEEIGARAVEAMVFHRAKRGDSDPIPRKASELLNDSGGGAEGGNDKEQDGGEEDNGSQKNDIAEPNAMRGLSAMKGKGMLQEEIVMQVAQKIVEEMERKENTRKGLAGIFRGYTS